MCELHRQKCVGCKLVYTTHAKLPGCESDDPNAICQPSLCVYLGDPKKPTWTECQACRDERERREEEEEEEQRQKWREEQGRREEEQRWEREDEERRERQDDGERRGGTSAS
ncbi:hypothetical protein F4801DRAFT_579646 [Xylaria longipes]|nr:hypothetical protein F4801DRAFT_579646 [Xylaria longipes]RYC62113.1 hypothetical protein CHU98_g4086 [Xylaria longipes]